MSSLFRLERDLIILQITCVIGLILFITFLAALLPVTGGYCNSYYVSKIRKYDFMCMISGLKNGRRYSIQNCGQLELVAI